MQEKRRYIRVKAENEKRPISVHINGVNFLEISRVNDISEGGISILAPHMFEGCEIDSAVSLLITLPFPVEHEIMVKGLIRHTDKLKFGVRFLDLNRKDQKLLHRYVKHRLRKRSFIIRLKHSLHLI